MEIAYITRLLTLSFFSLGWNKKREIQSNPELKLSISILIQGDSQAVDVGKPNSTESHCYVSLVNYIVYFVAQKEISKLDPCMKIHQVAASMLSRSIFKVFFFVNLKIECSTFISPGKKRDVYLRSNLSGWLSVFLQSITLYREVDYKYISSLLKVYTYEFD